MPKKNAKAQKTNELDGAEFFAAQPGDGAQIQHAGDLHVRAPGHDLVNARADGAHAQQSDSHDLSPSALR